jgi:hypothetical protein
MFRTLGTAILAVIIVLGAILVIVAVFAPTTSLMSGEHLLQAIVLVANLGVTIALMKRVQKLERT